MPSIQWNPRYATGIPAIDAQHKNLVEAIHRLQHALESGLTREDTMELMRFLLQYMDEHFTLEEAYMAHIGFPDLEHHKLIHQRLRMRVNAIHDRLAREEPGSAMELSLLLFEWLRDHILHDDFSYVEHARKHERLA